MRGSVRNATTGDPVVRATVRDAGSGRGVTTDDRGAFVLRGLPLHPTTIRIRALGYQAVDRPAIPTAAGTTLDIQLVPTPQKLSTVRTEARVVERERFEQTPDVGAISLKQSAFNAVPAVGEPDILRTVQLLPGVLARNDYSAGYNVRGGEADQNLILLDGIPVYNPFHLGGMFGTFLDETVGSVNLMTGGFSSEYGGRLSSVLDVTTAEEARQGVHVNGGVSLLASSLMLGGTLPDAKTSWSIAGRRTYADKVASAFSDYDLPYHFQDGQLHGLRQLRNGGTISFTGYLGQDVLDGTFADFGDTTSLGSGSFAFQWGNTLGGVTWRQPLGTGAAIPLGGGKAVLLGDSALLTQQASVSLFHTTLDLGDGSVRFRNAVREIRYSGKLGWYTGRHQRTFGLEAASHNIRYGASSSETGLSFFHLKQNGVAGAAFLEDQFKASERVLLRGGVRGEHITGTSWWGVSPRAAIKVFVNPDLALSLAGGQYAQWIHAVRNEDVPVRIFDFWTLSDRYIRVSHAQHLVGGAERWFGNDRFIRIEGWGKRFQDLPEQNDADDPLVRGDEFNLVRGTSYGVDVMLRRMENKRFGGWLAYGYSVSSRRRSTDLGLTERYPPAQDRRHNLNVVASYHTARRYTFGARLGFGSGLPYTDVVGQIVRRTYDASRNAWDTDIVSRQIEPIGGSRNAARYPTFNRLDLSVTKQYQRGRTTIAPYVQVVNTLNRRNVFIYAFDYTKNPPTREAISQFPILPTVGLTVEF